MGVVAYIEVSGSSVKSADVPTSLTSVTKPYYLQDQTAAKADSEHSINFSQVVPRPNPKPFAASVVVLRRELWSAHARRLSFRLVH